MIGYNIYRNDVRLNAEPITRTNFTDVPLENGDYDYNVTALFSEGESPYSNTVVVTDFSGVPNVDNLSEISISGEDKNVIVESEAETMVHIYSSDGRLVRIVKVSGKERIPMQVGFYLVKCGDMIQPVIIK